jgi:hypothetical protein
MRKGNQGRVDQPLEPQAEGRIAREFESSLERRRTSWHEQGADLDRRKGRSPQPYPPTVRTGADGKVLIQDPRDTKADETLDGNSQQNWSR